MVLLACSTSTSGKSTDAGKIDGSANPASADVGPDPRAGDAAGGADGLARDVVVDSAQAADGARDTSPTLDHRAVDRGANDAKDVPDSAVSEGASIDATVVSDAGERCSCGDVQVSGPAPVSWACFCSVERCTLTLADFVEHGDGGWVLKPGQQTALLLDYAGCNRILVQAYTYSRQVPASEYAFDRATGALIGARVWLDDRQHTCPFPSSGARWVYGYQAGSHPIPSSCQAADCVPGSGTCPG